MCVGIFNDETGMINVVIPDHMTNKFLRKSLRTLSLTVANNHKPIDFTVATDDRGGMRLNAEFDTISNERYQILLELKPVEE